MDRVKLLGDLQANESDFGPIRLRRESDLVFSRISRIKVVVGVSFLNSVFLLEGQFRQMSNLVGRKVN